MRINHSQICIPYTPYLVEKWLDSKIKHNSINVKNQSALLQKIYYMNPYEFLRYYSEYRLKNYHIIEELLIKYNIFNRLGLHIAYTAAKH